MSAQLKVLYELQQVDIALAKAQKAKSSLDDGSAKRAEVEAARQEVEKARALLQEATAEMHDKDLSLKTVETKQKTFKDKLYGGTIISPKELGSIEKEVEMLGRQKDKLEERIIELLDIVEERKSALAASEAGLKEREDELVAYLEKLRQDGELLTVRIEELSVEREKALPAVDHVLLKKYESMFGRSSGIVVSKVEAENCSACHTQIMTGLMRELKADEEIRTCENCGRILYLEQ